MSIIRSIKQRIIAGAMNKQKAANPFDANYSDRFQLAADADGNQNNSYYFSVHDIKTGECFYLRLGLRGGDIPNEVWFFYRGRDGVVYIDENNHLEKGKPLPITVTCVKGGWVLDFTYRGTVKRGTLTDTGYVPDPASEAIPADLSARFEGITDVFEFSRHMSTGPVARSLSREKFTREFQAALAENHQIHYEQLGLVSGNLNLGGRKVVFDRLYAFRDHSYGKRDWNYMDRHIWTVAALENGDFLNTSFVRYPAITELQAGFYITGADKPGNKPVCLENCTSMDALPCTGAIPPRFSYPVEYADGKTRTVECELDFTTPYSFGGGSYLMHEGIGGFTVDGVKGRGMMEFGFNADPSRWNH
jgi:hypothetical protein